ADCEAKRRIIMRCEDILAGGAGEALALAQGILEDLAVAYATHPDSRKQPTREPPQDPVG
ncbi:MAG TPA: DUF6221 family protein, partial [Marmoricola sp.]